jgi:Uma2 family endonuclease
VKVEDYAKAGIPEYWMIDLAERQISVGVLRSGEYEFIRYSAGQQAESSVLKSFNVPVTQLFDGTV